ncbi:MAG: anthranilate phosphoribosyltransferase [Flavobacteriaceae bacterium]|nr:anthranilate phosphoribosyltransferase [Flavobacteriaceae bacterium]
MKHILSRLINHETISSEEAKQILINISKGNYNQSQIASFLTVFMMRSITLDELKGFRNALLELCVPVDLSAYNPIDLCGTGGDGKDTFNISTLSSFVTAAAGIPVAKHGNYGVSSACGSSNVLESLGVTFSNDVKFLERAIETTGICVLHAPLFHPAMKIIAPIRQGLGVKTFFNMLGPMVNPSAPKNQMVGVFNLELLRLYAYLYQDSDINYSIVHDLGGYDEISLTNTVKIVSNKSEVLFSAKDLGLKNNTQEAIFGGNTIAEASKIFKKIIEGQGSKAQNNVVCANAGLAIATAKNLTHIEGYELAKEALFSGKANQCLNKLIALK